MVLRLAHVVAVPIASASLAQAQGVASKAGCRLYAEQAAFADAVRDGGAWRDEVAPGLLQRGLGEGIVAVIPDVALDGQELPAAGVGDADYSLRHEPPMSGGQLAIARRAR